MTRREAYDLIDAYEADPDGPESYDNLCMVLDALPGQPEGIWTLPATQGAVRLAAESHFMPAHYDAVERDARRAGVDEIHVANVAKVKREIDTHEAAICGQCGLFHSPPGCSA